MLLLLLLILCTHPPDPLRRLSPCHPLPPPRLLIHPLSLSGVASFSSSLTRSLSFSLHLSVFVIVLPVKNASPAIPLSRGPCACIRAHRLGLGAAAPGGRAVSLHVFIHLRVLEVPLPA